MSSPTILAVDVNDAVPEEIRAKLHGRLSFAPGLAAIGMGEDSRLPPEFVAAVSRELDPDRWEPTNVPKVFAVRNGEGRPFLAWECDGGTVLGMAGELALALEFEAAVLVVIPVRANVSIQ